MDKAEFIALIDEKSKTMYRIAWSILRNDMDCGDAMQECAVKAWTSRCKLRDDSVFSTWLIRILINECHNLQRKKKKFVLASEIEQDGEPDFPDLDLQTAIDNLPENLRVPFVLHYVEGYSQDETAHLLRLPPSTVRDRLYRARKTLRIDLRQEEEVCL